MTWLPTIFFCAVLSGSLLADAGSLTRQRRQDVNDNNVQSGEWVSPASGDRLEDAEAYNANLEETRNRLTQQGRRPVNWNDRIDRARQQTEGVGNNGSGAARGNTYSTGNSRSYGGANHRQRETNYNNNYRGRSNSYGYNDDYDNSGRYGNAGRYSTTRNADSAADRQLDGSSYSSGGGLFGSSSSGSMLGGLLSRIGQGISNAVQGVSRALANKWDAKVQAFRGLASNGLRAAAAHPRFALEAVEHVLEGR